MNFVALKNILAQLIYLRRTLKKYSDVLQNGNYYLFASMSAAVVDKPENLEPAQVYFSKKDISYLRTKIINKLNGVGFLKNKSNSKQKYEAFYVANNHDKVREVKLFSFKQKKIMTICASNINFENQVTWYNQMSDSYNMPKITLTADYKDSYEVSMVDLHTRPDEKEALKNILFSTQKYYKDKTNEIEKQKVSDLLIFNYDDEKINLMLENICLKISADVLNIDLPLCIQHGDLSRDNLIYGESGGKTDFWWIDWEHLGKRVFFYDYYFYILNTALYFSDTQAFDTYISGANNDELKKYFNHFGVAFYPEKLKEYFLVFFVIFLKERVCNELGNLSTLKMYYDFVIEKGLLLGE